MKRFHIIIPLVLFLFMSALGVVIYEKIAIENAEEVVRSQKIAQEMAKREEKNEKIRKLEKFMAKYKSPLYPYAKLIVEQAYENNIDYRLIPSIAMNESTLCKAIPFNSYNCWGWGIYGDTVTRFNSYEDAVETISRGLRKYYYDRGMASPSAIMRSYTPSSPDGIWARKIHMWYEQIEKM